MCLPCTLSDTPRENALILMSLIPVRPSLQAKHEFNRVFRGANFNQYAHHKFRSKYHKMTDPELRGAPRVAPEMASQRFKVAPEDRPVALAEAGYSRYSIKG